MRSALLCLLALPVAAVAAQHVVVIGLDGARPELVRDYGTGALRSLWREGAYTWHAEAAVPSVTQVNFAGILTSCLPAKHGIDRVEWVHGETPKVRVTTVFEVLSSHGLPGAAFLGHEKLYPVEKGPLTGIHFEHSPGGSRQAAPLEARWIREHQPAFTFVYFGDLDGAGHKYGWMSQEQIAAMAGINAGVDQVLAAIRETAMRDSTVVIVTADHGGHGKSHSLGTIEDRTIPWICWGSGVKRGVPISAPVRNYDTAATALHALGIAAPAEWDGRVPEGVFR